MTDQIGVQLPQPDPRGWLVFDHLPADLQRAEDARAAADADRLITVYAFERDATPTERQLLEHLGHDLTDYPLADEVADGRLVRLGLKTKVQGLGVRRRSWHQLDDTEPRYRAPRPWWG